MSKSAARTFTAVLEPDGTRLMWVIARVPFDAAEAWPERRGMRVRGEIEGFGFRTSLFPDPRGAGRVLLVNKKMLAGAKAKPGQTVRIRLEPDLEERAAVTPPELARALKGDRRLTKWFEALTYSCRKEMGDWVTQPKSAESRRKRAEQMAVRLLLTLEGELETPPILEAAFRRQPLARVGWEAMTPTQRRRQLLSVFYCETPEARERRAARAVEEAVRLAARKTGRGIAAEGTNC
jgi:uncharacterized protein YdeI (YjbR/CyaY-like superfamily)